MANKKVPAPSPNPALHTEAPTYTWETLLAAVSAPTAEDRALYAPTTSPADLVASGARIRSDKILTDFVRFAGLVAEFLPRATPAQRRRLLGFSDTFFQVAVHEGKRLLDMAETRGDAKEDRDGKRAASADAAARSYAEGLDERERLVTALEALTAYDTTLQGRIDIARGRVVDAATLSKSLLRLEQLLSKLLTDAKSTVARQLVDGGVTNDELTAIKTLAADVVTRGKGASGALALGPVTQAELDQQDGICLIHMERLMKIFNAAHDKDPSIPQLFPISTRQIFAPTRKRSAAVDAPAEEPTLDDPKATTGGTALPLNPAVVAASAAKGKQG